MSSERSPTHHWSKGDRVRVDIPDETDPDHRRFHGRHGHVIAIIGRERVSTESVETRRYRVEFDDGGYADVRWFDLRPPIVE